MKHTIIASSLALALLCVSGGSIAQEHSQPANLQHVTVTAAPGQYETYETDLNTGFGLKVRVGNRHGQYLEAQRATKELEALRKRGMAQSPFVNVAIDNSSGERHVWQLVLSDRAQRTLAIVDVYCKHFARDGDNWCQVVPQPVSGSAGSQGLASGEMRSVSLAQVQVDSR